MPRIEAVQSGAAKAATEAAYEEVRQSFLLRLRGEETRLATLTRALEAAEANPAAVFGDLEQFAHRLRGAAAVFDMPELRDSAKFVELAASAALARRAPNTELHLRRAMRVLIARLSLMNGGATSTDDAVAAEK